MRRISAAIARAPLSPRACPSVLIEQASIPASAGRESAVLGSGYGLDPRDWGVTESGIAGHDPERRSLRHRIGARSIRPLGCPRWVGRRDWWTPGVEHSSG